MNPEMLAHERARSLAADAVDIELEPTDAGWLDGHLAACPDCSSIADEYKSIHLELRSLPMPEPPRDLWARTSAALDAAEATSGKSLGLGRGSRAGRRPLFSTTAAVGIVVVVATASIISQTPILNPGPASSASNPVAVGSNTGSPGTQAPITPLAYVEGHGYWIDATGNQYDIKGGAVDCSQSATGCTVTTGSSQTLGSITSDSEVSAVIGPDAKSAAVWTSGKVAIVPLSAGSQTVRLDLLTPRPTIVATASPTTAPPGDSPTPAAPTPTPTATAAPTQGSGQPVAILSGYEIVGRDPEFSPDGAFVAFAARPIDHSTGPDVFIWKSGQEQAQRVTKLHSDLFAGWFGGRLLISEIAPAQTAAAGGSGVVGAASFVYDPAADSVLRISRPMLLPAVDPTGRYLVYWSGAVRFDPGSGLWQPGSGELYFDEWSNLTLTPAVFQAPDTGAGPADSAAPTDAPNVPEPTATPTEAPSISPDTSPDASAPVETSQPTATPTAIESPLPGTLPELLPVAGGPAAVFNWIVRWDKSGQFVAVWVGNPGSDKIGRLTAFSVDQASGILNVNEPRLNTEKVLSTISFDGTSVVYTSAVTGKTFIQALPVVPPSNASTPAPTEPGQTADPSADASPAASDRLAN